MSAVWLRLRSDFRHRWRSWVGLALIVGFSAGAAMALAQAARRSEHAYRRFSDREASADVVMTGFSTFGLVGGVDLDAVARSGFVERSARAFVGLLLGTVLGQVAWRVFAAHQLGVASDAVVSPLGLVVVAAGAVVLALAAAVLPASIAARTHLTRALRAE